MNSRLISNENLFKGIPRKKFINCEFLIQRRLIKNEMRLIFQKFNSKKRRKSS